MNIPSCKGQDRFSNRDVVVECQHCGDLFELKTYSIPRGKSVVLTFSPFVNLVMMVTGSASIKYDQSSFELTMGQVWLAGFDEEFELTNDLKEQDVVVICVGIRAAMLTRFYERYDNALLNKKQALKMVKSVLPKGKAPIIFPSCDLTRLTLDSFRLFSRLDDHGLNALKLEELLLLKLKSDHGQILADELLNRVNPAQEKFRRFMEANITKNWSIATYAKNIGMSLTSFKNMFGQVFRESSPKSWVNERRLRHADIQLRTTSKRLVDIAIESGFSSQSYFTQLYKSKYGVSPSEARQKCI
ncbi:helix-turn-helix transcriptional regulator [Microbulbifer variabilis]|uniref:helix-turn-helix transcriptional regulator n=1 Tax=Microbulbifer variabilis TaxID=266805 RepID=UPI001CFE570A|nr:AraC family transcriptional regulator [Microbulbifer variabilis]